MVDIIAGAEDSKLGKLGTAEQLDERDQKCEEGMLDMLMPGSVNRSTPKRQSKVLRRPGAPSRNYQVGELTIHGKNKKSEINGCPI